MTATPITTRHTRHLQGTELPSAGTWVLDPGHTSVEFVGRHFMLTKVRGRFTSVAGSLVIGEDPTASSLDVTIDMASVSSGSQDRDDHLRSTDLFDVDRFPTATFRSTRVRWDGGAGAAVDGELTIVGVTRPVTLDVAFVGAAVDPSGNEKAVFSASAELDREDFGLTWNMVLESGGLLVSKKVRLEIETELVRTV
jgi:polyisoprenoid-binding protein YceI